MFKNIFKKKKYGCRVRLRMYVDERSDCRKIALNEYWVVKNFTFFFFYFFCLGR
jgi:hypothetical protein